MATKLRPRLCLWLALCLVLGGCSSTPPPAATAATYAEPAASAATATLRCKIPNPLVLESSIYLEAIDGQPLSRSRFSADVRRAAISAGPHRITLGCKGGVGPIFLGQVVVTLEATAGTEYFFTTRRVAGGFHVEVRDLTHGSEKDPPLQTLLAPDTDQI